MIVCIDSGNSRIKWAVHADGNWLAQGALTHADVNQLAELPARYQPTQVIFSNVAGAAAASAIRAALSAWQDRLSEARSAAAACGVSNGYENPLQLGVDRWSALIGARALTRAPCLVVMAGTATTIDTLDGEGRFCGGLILPGIHLMQRALSRDTAALPLASGQYVPYPKNTDDAIVSGCLEAQAGAVERAFQCIAHLPNALCLLSGGAAPSLAPLLHIPHQRIDNLVLEGLARMSQASG